MHNSIEYGRSDNNTILYTVKNSQSSVINEELYGPGTSPRAETSERSSTQRNTPNSQAQLIMSVSNKPVTTIEQSKKNPKEAVAFKNVQGMINNVSIHNQGPTKRTNKNFNAKANASMQHSNSTNNVPSELPSGFDDDNLSTLEQGGVHLR